MNFQNKPRRRSVDRAVRMPVRASALFFYLVVLALYSGDVAHALPDAAGFAAQFDQELSVKPSSRAARQNAKFDDAALTKRFENRFKEWLEEEYPKTPSDKLETAFIENLTARIGALSQNDATALRRSTEETIDYNLDRMFGAAALYTVADDAVLQGADGQEWQRGDQGAFRRWDKETHFKKPEQEWQAITAMYSTHERSLKVNRDQPLRPIFGRPDSRNPVDRWRKANAVRGADQTRRSIQRHFEAVYGALGILLDEALAKDLARLQYLTAGLMTKSDGGVVPVGIADLLSLERLIEANPNQSLSDILRGQEVAEGFDRPRLVATNALSPERFLTPIMGGYHLDDVGVGPDHGADTHRVQWNMVINHYRANPEAFTHAPLELFRMIGKTDIAMRAQTFGFERPALLWDRIFDQIDDDDYMKVLARPEQVRDILVLHPELSRLSGRLQQKFDATIKRGEDLLNEASNLLGNSRLDFGNSGITSAASRQVAQGMYDDYLKLLNDGADQSEIDEALEELESTLFRLEYFDEARSEDYLNITMPDENGGTSRADILSKNGGSLDPAAFDDESASGFDQHLKANLNRQRESHLQRAARAQRDPDDASTTSNSSRRKRKIDETDSNLIDRSEQAETGSADSTVASTRNQPRTAEDDADQSFNEGAEFADNAFPEIPADDVGNQVGEDDNFGKRARKAGEEFDESELDEREVGEQEKKKKGKEEPQLEPG